MEPEEGDPVVPDIIVVNGATTPWWQNWRWIASVSFCVFVVAVVFIAVLTLQAQRNSVKTLKRANEAVGIANAAVTIQQNNADVLARLDKNQTGIDELVAFIHTLQAQQANPQTSQSTEDFFTILCSNPTYTDVCVKLGRP